MQADQIPGLRLPPEDYGTGTVLSRIRRILQQSSHAEELIDWRVLAPFDHLHVGGVTATVELAKKLCIKPGSKLLDVGCGFGGPARCLAAVYGCHVTGIDLNQPFVELAQMLTRRTGLSERVQFVHGDVVELPLPQGAFDIVWMQHLAMRIAEPDKLYRIIRNVLRRGARFAIYEQVAGEGGPMLFPVPWARDPAESFLISPDQMRKHLELFGFRGLYWNDVTDAGIRWGEERDALLGNTAELSELHGSTGQLPVMKANLGRNLRERRIRLIQAIFERSS